MEFYAFHAFHAKRANKENLPTVLGFATSIPSLLNRPATE